MKSHCTVLKLNTTAMISMLCFHNDSLAAVVQTSFPIDIVHNQINIVGTNMSEVDLLCTSKLDFSTGNRFVRMLEIYSRKFVKHEMC